MPHELVALEPRKPVLREYEEPELRLRQIRIRTEFASPKHGTEMVGYRNEPSARRAYDPEWGCMIPVRRTKVRALSLSATWRSASSPRSVPR